MRKSKFTDAQIAFISRQAEEGTSISEVCRRTGIAEATFYNWRKKYGGLMPAEMKRLKQLDKENARLKHLMADLSLTTKRCCCRTSSNESCKARPVLSRIFRTFDYAPAAPLR